MEWAGQIIDVGRDAWAAGWRRGDDVMGTGSGLSSVLTVNDHRDLKRMPKTFSYSQGSAFWVGMSTAYHCLVERANLQKGERILINGATGGMGMAAVLLAKKIGAQVYATGGADSKLARVSKFTGIARERFLNYTKHESFSSIVKTQTNQEGVDVVFDPVGGRVGVEGLKATAWGARYCIVGFTSGTKQVLRSNYVLIKGLTVLGCRAGEFVRQSEDGEILEQQRRQHLLAWAEDDLVPMVGSTYEFTSQGVQKCFYDLLERKVVGRAVVVMPTEEQNVSRL
eukprot:g2979.t1